MYGTLTAVSDHEILKSDSHVTAISIDTLKTLISTTDTPPHSNDELRPHENTLPMDSRFLTFDSFVLETRITRTARVCLTNQDSQTKAPLHPEFLNQRAWFSI